ncbi:MAG: hypothetical protein J6N70_15365, partial [Oribacterium sp.]|nr:hypothetical protein [Oribacterium sp.]
MGLLAALLSSLDVFPYSYAIQEIQYSERGDVTFANKLGRRNVFKYILENGGQNSLKSQINHIYSKYGIETEDLSYII